MKRRFHESAGATAADGFTKQMSRRELLRGSLVAGGALLAGFEKIAWPRPSQAQVKQPIAKGTQTGTVPFTEESRVPMETVLGAELDGRLYTDLSKLSSENRVTPTKEFYIRTRASNLLDTHSPWRVRAGGLAARAFGLSVAELRGMTKPMGLHLMECAGNARSVHFGMMSVAEWGGVPWMEILERAKAKPEATRVLLSGFDEYANKSASSVPGASWIFSFEDLKSAGAFLATEMNGSDLTKDHGAPIRLMVPGWYGCTCIKWLNEITFVDDGALATSQMQEYAARTMQAGVPRMAREYRPAMVEPAAMPIRIEQWMVEGKTRYLVVGIQWGGMQPVKQLQIRFNPEEDYVAVDNLENGGSEAWRFWTHAWTPKETGTYMIRLRVGDAGTVTRRLDTGYYMRTVEITEI